MGATVDGRQCGSFGDYSAISFNGNKIITGSSGGCLLTNEIEVANKARKWSTQAREAAAWYQHEEVGYNYRMSNVIAGVIRGQYPYLEEHIAQKKAIYERYREGLKDLPVTMNPITAGTEPNYWLSALIIDKDYMCRQVRDDKDEIRPGKKNFCVFRIFSSSNDNRKVRWQEVHTSVCILQYCKAIILKWTSCNITACSLRRTPMSVHLTGGKVARRSTANGHLARLPIKAAR